MTPPYIVAEMSASHLGSLDRALTIIKSAADAGANAIKMQLYDPQRLAPEGLVIDSGPWAGRNAQELYKDAQTSREWFPYMLKLVDYIGIDWFSSVFDIDGLKFLESWGCPRYKISSFEIVDLDLIRVVAATGKPMVISTGMATKAEINSAIAPVRATRSHLTLLKCTSAYPAQLEDANLDTLKDMRIRYGCEVGISDHTLGSTVPVVATALGATMIEKHLTLRRSDGGPDAEFSMEPGEFAQMVTECRQAAAAIGTARYGPTEAEMPQMQLRGRTMLVNASPRETST